MHIAKAAKRMGGEAAYAVLAKAKALEAKGKSIVHMEIGQPDFATPAPIVQAGIRALKEGHTRYTATLGMPELREAIARNIAREHGVKVGMERIAVTPSAKTALFVTMSAIVDPGDEVIYPNPGFPAYENIIKFLGGVPKPLPLLEKNNFSFDVATLERLITKKTRLIIINSPSNPTGGVIPRRDLLAIARLVKKRKDLFILDDEIYAKILYDGITYPSIYSIPGMDERTFLVDGFSKSFSMTGWRLGYIAAPQAIMPKLDDIGVNLYACAADFVQYAGITAIESGAKETERMVKEFEKRRDVLVDGLNAIPGITCLKPEGAFYVFPNITGTKMSAEKLALELLEKAGVAVLPGTAFGVYGKGYLRLSYANSLENIREALRRIERYLLS